MVGINEKRESRYVLMIIAQQRAEMAIASYLTNPSTGGNRLMEEILERENMARLKPPPAPPPGGRGWRPQPGLRDLT